MLIKINLMSFLSEPDLVSPVKPSVDFPTGPQRAKRVMTYQVWC